MPRHSLGDGHRIAEDLRGSSFDRRSRRHWLLETFGDGTIAPCCWCGQTVAMTADPDRGIAELHVDRFPICGHSCRRLVGEDLKPCRRTRTEHGDADHPFEPGRYTRDNIVPSCPRCNLTRCESCRGAYEEQDLQAYLATIRPGELAALLDGDGTIDREAALAAMRGGAA
jgi:hypothetical protein